jgi:hypothetical protein
MKTNNKNKSTNQQIIKLSLRKNIVYHNNKQYMLAGYSQFRTIWIRDTLLCTDILKKIGLESIVKNTIDLYIQYCTASNDYLIGPKGFDTMNLETRVVMSSIKHFFGLPRSKGYFKSYGTLIPLYKDSRNSIAIDSNILVVYAILKSKNLYSYTKDIIDKLLNWYVPKITNDILIYNDCPYSDWRDSQDRLGYLFCINLFFYLCLVLYEQRFKQNFKYNYKQDFKQQFKSQDFKKAIIKKFYNKNLGIFVSLSNKDTNKNKNSYIGLDDNLFAIKYDFYKSKDVYDAIKQSPLFNSSLGIFGFAMYPNYPNVHWQVSIAGLDNYHNDLYWGWLMGFSCSIAKKMNDTTTANKTKEILDAIIKRDSCLSEIYKQSPNNELKIFKSMTYSAERPFSMASCFYLDPDSDPDSDS